MSAAPATRRFTVDEYHRMAEVGILSEDDRVELLEGEILLMSPIGSRHASVVARIEALLHRALGGAAIVWGQNPVGLSRFSEPQPDVCVLRQRTDFYAGRHPRPEDVLVVIEVADTSLRYDRDRKIPLYARAGIVETWLVDLPGDGIDVCREPSPEGYRDVRRVNRDGTLTAVQLPGLSIAAGEVLG